MINNIREEIIMRGYAKISDIRRFIPCGYESAKNYYAEIEEKIHSEGKKVYRGVLPKYLLEIIGLTEKQVHDYAELERKKAAAATATNKN